MSSDANLAAAAYFFASRAHRHQSRLGSGDPYILHPIRVAGMVEAHGGRAIAQAAAFLHDVVEDTPVFLDEIESRFGYNVSSIVAEVTKPAGISGRDYRRIILDKAPGFSPSAKLIKLADATDNLWELGRDPTIWSPKRVAEYLDAKVALVAIVGAQWPGLVAQFEANADRVRAYLTTPSGGRP